MDLHEAIRLDPENAIAYCNRGFAYQSKGNYNWAIVDYSQAIKLKSNHAAMYLIRGAAYRHKGDYDRAIEDYDNAVRLCPNYEIDFIDRNFVYGGGNMVEQAIQLLNGEVDNPPENAADYYYTGVRQLFINDRLSARRCFEIALRLGYGNQAKIEQHLKNLENQK